MRKAGKYKLESLAKKYVCDYRKKYIEISSGNLENVSFSEFIDLLSYYGVYEKKRLNGPVFVDWEVTSKCNLNCIHCYGGERSKERYLELDTNFCHYIIDQLSESNVVNVIIAGGEPFMRNDLVELLKHIKENHIKFEILTNGTRITKEYINQIEALGQFNKTPIQVSLDGPTAEIHNAQRGVDCFDRVLQGLKMLCKSDSISTSVKMTVTNINYKYIKETYELCKKLGVDVFATAHVCYIGKAKALPRLPENTGEILESALTLMEEGTDEKKTFYIDSLLAYMFNFPILRQYLPREVPKNEPLLKCPAGVSKVAIDYRGNVYPCAFLQSEEFKLGNIIETPLMELWKKDIKSWFPLRQGRDFSMVKCKDCEFLHFCRGGCPGSAYWEYGTMNAPDPACIYKPEK